MANTEDFQPPAAATTETSPLLANPDALHDSVDTSGDVETGHANGNGAAAGEAGQGQDEPAKEPPTTTLRSLGLLPIAVALGIFLVAIDQLLVVAIYTKVGNELNALNSTSWIATSYFLTLTSFQPLYGKLSDIFGRKECLLFAYAVFALGCLGCGLAQTMGQLCAARAVSGIGGGGMTSLISILMSDLVPLRDRGMFQGYMNIIYASGTSTGAPLGGFLADSIGWRWSFLIQVPICVVAWIAVYFTLNMPPKDRDHWLSKLKRVDFLGAAFLIASVVALLVGLDFGANLGWSDLKTIIPLALFPVLAALFVLIEVKVASHPFAPGHVILHRNMFACYLVNFCGSAGHMATIFFMPLYFQAVRGVSASQSGALLVPVMVTSLMSSVSAGYILKKTGRFYWVSVCSYALAVLGLIPLGLSIWFRKLIGQELGLVICTIGGSAGVTFTLIGLLANGAAEDSAVVIACSYLFRSLGSSFGIGISSAVMQQVLRGELALRLDPDTADEIVDKVRRSLEYIKQMPPQVAEQIRTSYRIAVLGAFMPVTVFAVSAFILTFWIKETSLKR